MLIRTTIGLGAAAAGLTTMTYGIAQAIENGSCGVDEDGNVLGAPCPDGFGEMILLMVLGTFVALAGAALASSLLRFIFPAIIAVCAGVVLGFVDLHEDDTRPGLEIIAAVAAPLVLFTVPFAGRRTPRGVIVPPQPAGAGFGGPPPPPAQDPTFDGAPPWQQQPTPGDPEAIAARLRQLDQLKAAGLVDDAAYAQQRQRILSEL